MTTTQQISALIKKTFDIGDMEISGATDFESLEFDSLVLVELAVILTRDYGVEITDEELAEAETIEATAALVNSRSRTLTA
ncbi:acyl carrier protein [Streptomyces sp. AC512_CC834]|uniref:acyl carrier protein n=1 Tax=Streptomyces sp. AC512_CC834 TaxID=2823691 RepID=UPI001C26CDEF|nr:acyl carrier protein [Streptomyces sp. AC512_CC834]